MNRIPCQSKRIGQIPAYSKNSYGNPFAIGMRNIVTFSTVWAPFISGKI
jgi:hypothetical protein